MEPNALEISVEHDLQRNAVVAFTLPVLGVLLPWLNHPVGTSLWGVLLVGGVLTIVMLVAGYLALAPVLSYADPYDGFAPDDRDMLSTVLGLVTIWLGLVASACWAPGESKISFGWFLIHVNIYVAAMVLVYNTRAMKRHKQAAWLYLDTQGC